MTKKQSRRVKARKQSFAMKAKGFERVGKTWVRVGSKLYDVLTSERKKTKRQ